MNVCCEFLQEFLIAWEAISNTRKSISSDFQTDLEVGLKDSAMPRFSNPLFGVWKSDEALLLVFGIQHYVQGGSNFASVQN